MADPDRPRKAPNQGDPRVNAILPLFGDSNFADILNRLWMNGAKVVDLQKGLTGNNLTGETPYDTIKRLLEQGVVTEEQLRAASTSYVPPNAAQAPWPFRPENKDKNGVVVPVFTDDSTKFYPDAPRPQLPPAPRATPIPKPAPTVQNVTVSTGEPKPKVLTDPGAIEQYQKDNFGNMLWVKNIPELNTLLDTAAREQWTAEKFKAHFENSEWWRSNEGSVRAFITLQNTDPQTLNSNIDTKTKDLLASSSALGLPFTYEDLVPIATDAIKFGWSDLETKQALTAKIQYDPNLAGGFGTLMTQAKSIGQNYLLNMTDDEAFDWARKLVTGEATNETITGTMIEKAKAAYPSIASLIESGTTPKMFFSEHINTAARLLEVDPSAIDLTSPKYHDIVNFADDKGQVRYMSVGETSKFIKQKDEYWKTTNSANEVSTVVTDLSRMFGRSAV